MSINVFTFSGNAGNDAEVRYTQNSKAIGEFSVACKQGYGDHEKTSWVTCKLFGQRAEKLCQYINKGAAMTVTGEFVFEQWEDQTGGKRGKPVCIVNDIQLAPGQAQGARQQPAQQQPMRQNQPPQQNHQHQYNEPQQFDDDRP